MDKCSQCDTMQDKMVCGPGGFSYPSRCHAIECGGIPPLELLEGSCSTQVSTRTLRPPPQAPRASLKLGLKAMASLALEVFYHSHCVAPSSQYPSYTVVVHWLLEIQQQVNLQIGQMCRKVGTI